MRLVVVCAALESLTAAHVFGWLGHSLHSFPHKTSATWFNQNIIDETGMVIHTPYKDPRNMTFDNDIFTNHSKHHIPG
jgi:hypothetical protein